MLKVKFSFDKMVSYWNKEHGAGVRADGVTDMSHWYTDVSWLDRIVEINSIDEVQSVLEEVLKDNYLPSDYFAIMEDGRISFNTLEDGDSKIIEGSRENEMHENGQQIFICDYSVNIEVYEAYEPTIEQLQQMFPKAEY